MLSKQTVNKTQWISLGLIIFILFNDMLLYSLIIPITPFLVDQLNPSSTLIGILFGSYAVGVLITTPLFAAISDRIGKVVPIIMGLIGMVLSTLFFAFASSMWMLIGARFVQGIAAAATLTASMALLAALFPANRRGAVMGMALTGISMGSLLGAPIGGWLLDAGGYNAPFIFAAGLILTSLVLAIFMLREPGSTEEDPHIETKKQGTFQLLRLRPVLFIAAIVLLAESVLTLLESILPVFLHHHVQATPTITGLLFAAMSLAYGAAAPLSGMLSDRYPARILMLIGLAALGLFTPLFAFAHTIWLQAGVMLLVGASVGFALSPTLSSLGAIVDDGDGGGAFGAAFGLFNILQSVGMIAGPFFGGILTDWLDVPRTIVTVSFALLLGVAALWILPKRMPASVRKSTHV
ncbi:MFS transporter [Paenibacillus bouchesdurhonensis]|uniref:MFS transporter n=1 Tax=Paenibacillus bouchesdurhonensis TaxID=1870990 RepID=UPI000DA607D8|nr:MFS transporter [Paenibacillus bouchesdurhonensis]